MTWIQRRERKRRERAWEAYRKAVQTETKNELLYGESQLGALRPPDFQDPRGIGSDIIQLESRREGDGVRHSLMNCTLDLVIIDLTVLGYDSLPRRQMLGDLQPTEVVTFWEPNLTGHANITYTYLIRRAS